MRALTILLMGVLAVMFAGCPASEPLTVEAVLPADGDEHASLGGAVRITFSEEIDGTTITEGSFKVSGSAGPLDGTRHLEADGRTLVFEPDAKLHAATRYTIELSTEVRSLAGTVLAKPFHSGFKTGSPAGLKAGAASVDLTPPVGAPLAGHSSGGRRSLVPDLSDSNYHTLFNPSKGVHDPLSAKALVLSNGVRKIAFLKLDLVAIEKAAVKDIAARILASTGITPENLFVFATHNHSGTGAVTRTAFWQVLAGDSFDERLYEHLISNSAKALIAANSALVPAKIGFGVATESRIQRNRREHPGHFDPEVGLIKVTHADGAPLAVLLNFAMHASAVPPESLLISADAVGVAEKTIERELGGKVVAIWAQGAEGDVSPKHKGFEGIEKSGGMLAHTVLAALDDIATESTIDLDVATTTVRFRKPKLHYSCDRPGDSEESPLIGELNFCEIYKLVSGSSFSVGIPLEGLIERSFPFKVLRMGKTVILFVPGEPLTTLGLELKAGAKALGYETPFVFGLSNDHMSYVADKASYEEGGYEAIATLFGKDQAAIVKKTLLTLAKELVPEAD